MTQEPSCPDDAPATFTAVRRAGQRGYSFVVEQAELDDAEAQFIEKRRGKTRRAALISDDPDSSTDSASHHSDDGQVSFLMIRQT